MDRQTGASVSAEWIFRNAKQRELKGKTITEVLQVRVINPDALFVMKMISCRQTDIRDMFMLALKTHDKGFIKAEVKSRCDFMERFDRMAKVVKSKDFRNGLQGIYGAIDPQTFERSLNAVLAMQGD